MYGDTSVGTRGGGTMGSRSLQLGGNALWHAAQEVRRTCLNQAAQMLEVAPGDLELFDGDGRTDRGCVSAPSSSAMSYERYRRSQREQLASSVNENGIVATIQYQSDGSTYPFGTTIAVVSIDPDTGSPTFERFVSVDDVGNVINPMLVEGQLIGGAVQGIGEVLWEQVAYDDNGQLLTGTLMDYAVPQRRGSRCSNWIGRSRRHPRTRWAPKVSVKLAPSMPRRPLPTRSWTPFAQFNVRAA